MSYDDVLNMRKFGSKTSKSCNIGLNDLEISNSLQNYEETNIFYELFL
jgi:hypothetical protein